MIKRIEYVRVGFYEIHDGLVRFVKEYVISVGNWRKMLESMYLVQLDEDCTVLVSEASYPFGYISHEWF